MRSVFNYSFNKVGLKGIHTHQSMRGVFKRRRDTNCHVTIQPVEEIHGRKMVLKIKSILHKYLILLKYMLKWDVPTKLSLYQISLCSAQFLKDRPRSITEFLNLFLLKNFWVINFTNLLNFQRTVEQSQDIHFII